jgi:hypothetical protein
VEDRASGRGNLIPAMVARIRLLAVVMMKQTILAALRAINSFRVSHYSNIIKANVIIREGLLKVFECEFGHGRFSHFGGSL